MNLTIRSVTVLDRQSKFHRKKVDIRISNGRITEIGKVSAAGGKEIKGKSLFVSPGWVDMNCLFGDPGYEHKEDRLSGSNAAAAGGFTSILHLPNTLPVIYSKNDLAYLKANNDLQVTEILPVAAVTLGTKGEELTEMIDLHHSGAIAFSDGTEPVWNSDILLKTLQYLQKFDGLLINRPEDKMLTQFGTMNEGVTSTVLGMKGMPALAEELMINRDLEILEYTGGRIHFSNISSAGSVKLIKRAKKNGLHVTCDVAAHQLLLDDSLLDDFNTDLKVNPPVRTSKDIKALIKGIKEGTIDAIVSAHRPQDEESKKLEFDLAEFGQIGLQTVLPNILSLESEIKLEVLLEKLTEAPRKILKLQPVTIAKDELADLTVFDTEKQWSFDEKTNLSKSRNSYFYGKRLTGMVMATVRGKNQYLAV